MEENRHISSVRAGNGSLSNTFCASACCSENQSNVSDSRVCKQSSCVVVAMSIVFALVVALVLVLEDDNEDEYDVVQEHCASAPETFRAARFLYPTDPSISRSLRRLSS